MAYRMAHMSEHNSNRGDRPIRNNINKIIGGLLLLAVLAIILTILFVRAKGKNMHVLHKSQTAPISAPIRT
jgi:hypothetical protein